MWFLWRHSNGLMGTVGAGAAVAGAEEMAQ